MQFTKSFPFLRRSSVKLEAPKPAAKFSVVIPPEMQEAMTFGGAIAPRISRAEALQVPAVKRSRDLICGTLASLPIHFHDRDRRVTRFTGLLEQIDRDVPNVVTLAETFEDLLFEGVAWWRITEFHSNSYPMHARHVPVSHVSVEPTTGLITINGTPVSDDQVIRFDSPNPPLLTHGARAIRTCLRLDRTAQNYADNPVPLGYFQPNAEGTDLETQEEIDELLKEWAETRRNNATGYVGKGLDLKPNQFDAEQIQLADQRQHAVLEISRAVGLTAEYLGVSTTSRTYMNTEHERLNLIDYTLRAYLTAVEQRLSMGDVCPGGYYSKMSLDGFLRSDTKTRMETYKLGLEVKAYTDEEIRELEDRPDLTPAQKAELTPQVASQINAPERETANVR